MSSATVKWLQQLQCSVMQVSGGNLSHRIEPPNHIPMETNSNGADAGQLQILSCG